MTENRPKDNGLMRCYNMFPTNFTDIDEMTTYLPKLKKMGFNVVWVNPLQLAGEFVINKLNHLGQTQKLKGSLYAMADTTQIDPRFSVVKRDKDGDMLLSEAQKKIAEQQKIPNIAIIKKLRSDIKDIQNKLKPYKINISANQKNNCKNYRNVVTTNLELFIKMAEKQDTAGITVIKELCNNIKNVKNEFLSYKKDTPSRKGYNNIIQPNLDSTIKNVHPEISEPNHKGTEQTLKKIKALLTVQLNELENKLDQCLFPHREFIQNLADEKTLSSIHEFNKAVETLSKNKISLEQKLKETEEELNHCLLSHRQFINLLDDDALRNFTSKAKSLGITPIFDLALNHVAIDAPFINDPRFSGFFNLDDKTFPDATAFIYSRLIGSKRKPPASGAEREKIIQIIPIIINEFWKPFLQKYIQDYGFCGARVDCVRKIPVEVRGPIYAMIKEFVNQSQGFLGKPIILEETLFSDASPEESIKIIQSIGATHNIASIYYKEREWHGGMPYNYNEEAGYKQLLVENGVINFTGNHDHHTCAMTVCRTLAYERLKQNEELFNAYLEYTKLTNHPPSQQDLPPIDCDEFMYYYTKEIMEELHLPEQFNNNIIRFGMAYRDKMLTSIFSGSGGYYMLSGDEYASFNQPSVFINKNGYTNNPTYQLKIFISEYAALADLALEEIVSEQLKKRSLIDTYKKLSIHNKKILCSSMIEDYKNDIHLNNIHKRNIFSKKVVEISNAKNLKVPLDLLKDTIPLNNNFQNKWSAPASLEKFASLEFISEVNHILKKLPVSKKGFWSELFKVADHNLFIAVRVNDIGYRADTDVVIFNINPHKCIKFHREDMHKIALWLQARGFNNIYSPDNPEYHKAYGCIMGSEDTYQKPANLYFGGDIEISPCLTQHAVSLDKRLQGFNIIVEPKQKESNGVIFEPAPETIFFEEAFPTFAFKKISKPLLLSGETSDSSRYKPKISM